MVKNLPAMQEIQVQSQGREDPLEKRMATHSRILAWEIPWRGALLTPCDSPWGYKSHTWKPSPPPPTRSLVQPGIRMSLQQILPQSLQRECNPVSILISAFCDPKQRTQSHHLSGLLVYRLWATKWVWFKWASLVTQLVKNPPAMQETPVQFLGWKTSWRRDSLPPPVFLLGESHKQRSLAGYSL